jgi:polar amino acid transport system permease protein
MTFRFEVLWAELPLFATGLYNTVWLCAVAMVASLLLAIVLVVPLMSRRRLVQAPVRAAVDLLRSVPFLLLAYLVYYGLPTLGVSLDAWSAGIATLVVYNTAYIAEILRAAWAHLPREQTEAAHAFGFTGVLLFRRIILPQVVFAAGPILGNQLVQLIKDSAFLYVITVPELTFAANSVQSLYFVPFESFLLATLLYWALCGGVEAGVKRLERAAAPRRDTYVKA